MWRKQIRRKQGNRVGIRLKISHGNRQQRGVSTIGRIRILLSQVGKKIERIPVDAQCRIGKLKRGFHVTGVEQLSRQLQTLAGCFRRIERSGFGLIRGFGSVLLRLSSHLG